MIIDWEQLGIGPPDGERPERSAQEAPEPPRERPATDALRAIEARHARDATFAPEAQLAAERQAIEGKLQGLEEEAEELAAGGLAAAERNARLRTLDRRIEELGIEAAVLDEAIAELEKGNTESAVNYFSAREVEAAAALASAQDGMEAAVERMKEAVSDTEALVAAAAEVNAAKVAVVAAERKHQRLADQIEYLKRKDTRAA